ncbi:hypothetical protein ACIBLA_05060 [Streptomyces sp. NPDC050433]|uniref:hypothetical protein n=1 Tax=Streptomyces sp. NPDC050433 TaxID=3365615 RepID=UPI0037914156
MASVRNRFAPVLVSLSTTAVIAGCSTTGAGESNTPEEAPSSASRRGPYADGEYTVDGEYGVRGSSIGVRLTLEGGEITTVDVIPHATNETSRGLQQRFADAVPQLVVGRDIDDVRLDRVAGNSNTPKGFNDALEEIKDEARR